MQLSDFVNQAEALPAIETAFKAARTSLSVPVAQAIARDVVKHIAQDKFKDIVRQRVQDIYDLHIMSYGEPDPKWRTFQWAGWAEPLEDQVVELFDTDEQLQKLTSMDFRGTVDAKAPRTQDEVERFCARFADDAWRCLTAHTDYSNKDEFGTEKTPGQILSSVGVVTPDIEALIPAAPSPEQQKEYQTVDEETAINELRSGAELYGLLDNDKQLTAAIDNASDDDAGVSQAGCAACGVEWSEDLHNTLVMARMTHGLEGIVQRVKSGEASQLAEVHTTVQEPVQPTTPAPNETASVAVETVSAVPPAPKKTRKSKVDAEPGQGAVPLTVLTALKDYTGIKAEDLGAGVGASRTTFLNYCNGKAVLHASPTSKQYMMDVFNNHIAALEMARDELAAIEV